MPTVSKALYAARHEAAGCTRCPLYRVGTRTVFGEGPAPARLMLVGEQPGALSLCVALGDAAAIRERTRGAGCGSGGRSKDSACSNAAASRPSARPDGAQSRF
jgi:hypothetical protein